MSRRDAIIVAVLINACLLTLLFVSAVTQKEEMIVQNPRIEPREMMSQQEAQEPVLVEARKPELPSEEKKQEPIVHKLPTIENDTTAVLPPPVKGPEKPKEKEVVVRKGDSLEKIAKVNHCSVKEIVALNQLNSSFLRVGQVLKIPKGKPVIVQEKPEKTKQESHPEVKYYTVKSGDNPWTIAMKHHLKVEELLKLNQLNEEKARKIKPGDRLRIR